MCLAHSLRELEYPIVIAHLNHMARGAESDEDERLVRRLAEELCAPFTTFSVNVAERAVGESFEAAARKARYDFLAQAARQHECVAIATGHTLDDQAETVLIRLIRGTSPQGLSGISPRGDWEGTPVVRPLIDVTREDVLAYLAERGFRSRTDSSNEDRRFLRNRVRLDLLPLLRRDFNPAIVAGMARLADLQRAEGELVERFVDELDGFVRGSDSTLRRETFRDADPALRRRLLLRVAWAHGAAPDSERVDAAVDFIADGRTGAALDLGGGARLVNGRDETRIYSNDTTYHSRDEVVHNVPGTVAAFGKVFQSRLIDGHVEGAIRDHCSPTRQLFDADAAGARLTIRTRRDGDRFTPLGMQGSIKVGDYFTERGVIGPERERVPLVLNDETVLWVVGYVPSEPAAVRPNTRRILEITVEDAS